MKRWQYHKRTWRPYSLVTNQIARQIPWEEILGWGWISMSRTPQLNLISCSFTRTSETVGLLIITSSLVWRGRLQECSFCSILHVTLLCQMKLWTMKQMSMESCNWGGKETREQRAKEDWGNVKNTKTCCTLSKMNSITCGFDSIGASNVKTVCDIWWNVAWTLSGWMLSTTSITKFMNVHLFLLLLVILHTFWSHIAFLNYWSLSSHSKTDSVPSINKLMITCDMANFHGSVELAAVIDANPPLVVRVEVVGFLLRLIAFFSILPFTLALLSTNISALVESHHPHSFSLRFWSSTVLFELRVRQWLSP